MNEFNVLKNFRDEDGNYPYSHYRCTFCDTLVEALVIVDVGDWMKGPLGTLWDHGNGNGNGIMVCKGCLTDMIKAIDKAYIENMTTRKPSMKVLDEDDGYCD